MWNFAKINIHTLDSAASEQRYLLEYGDRIFEANSKVVELLETLQTHTSRADAVEAFRVKHSEYTSAQIDECIDLAFEPIFNGKGNTSGRGFLYKKQFIDGPEIEWLTAKLKHLFHWQVALPVAVAAIALDVWFLLTSGSMRTFDGTITATLLIVLGAFLCASSFFHELGHASACRYMGIRHGGIGFAMYLTFPIFFTDVTQAWKLPRLHRMAVNLGGIYFQLYILIALLGWYMATGSDMARYLALAMNLGFLLVLNPFFRFDGYWIASDLLGVPNLRRQSTDTLRYALARLRKHVPHSQPDLLAMKGCTKWAFIIYCVVVNLFMGYFFFYVIPMFIYKFCQTFPADLERLFTFIAEGLTPSFALLHNIAGQLLFLAMIGYMIYGLARPYYKRFRTCLKDDRFKARL